MNVCKKPIACYMLLLLIIFVLCSLEYGICTKHSENPFVSYSVDLQIVKKGYNGEWCWFHPRAAICDDEKNVVMLMQPWITTHSDLYQFLSEFKSIDGGRTWEGPYSLFDSLGEKWENNVMVRICDVTPQWHQNSGKILATGVTVRYRDSVQYIPCPRETCYFSYDPKTEKWSSWKTLKLPNLPEFYNASVGCSQWVDLPDGDVLLPIYMMLDPNENRYAVTVLRCHFDGKTLTYIEHGNYLETDRARGYYEPSLIKYKGIYYLTMRNDINGAVSVSADGLHYDEPVEWRFNDFTYVWTENTQQHWLKSPSALFLVYTSSHRKESENVYRGRAPLFMSQFDEKNLVLIKETERVIVPNNGAQLGNFGAFDLNDNESWITTSEGMDYNNSRTGADGRVYVAKIKWNR